MSPFSSKGIVLDINVVCLKFIDFKGYYHFRRDKYTLPYILHRQQYLKLQLAAVFKTEKNRRFS